MESDRDFWYHDLMSMPIASAKCETEVMDAEDPLFILYTSGYDREAKGTGTYPWRIYGIYIHYIQVCFRLPAGGPLVVRGRSRLDYRP